jgi:ATP-binding cassette subfamily B multidrug efflux pump
MKFLKVYVKKYFRIFLAAIFFLSIEATCDLLQPTVMSKIVDNGIKTKDISLVLKLGGLMLIITAIGACAAITRNIIASNVSQKFGTELRGDLYKKINKLSFDKIDRFETASLVTRLTNDVTQLQQFVNGMMRIFVKAPLLCIGSIIMAIIINPKMSLTLLIIVPIIIVLIYLNTKISFPFFRRVQQCIDKINSVMREFLSGIRVVKAFNRSEFEMERFSVKNNELTSVQTKAMRTLSFFPAAMNLTVNLGIVAIIWLGGIDINTGKMQVGQIIAYISYMTQILTSLMMISNVFTSFVRAKASTERINEVMIAQSTIIIPEHPVQNKNLNIEFDNISFHYDGGTEPVLKNISFSCLAGETVGIIGSTGSGKTSLINLIPRFYDATEGTVKIGGIDIKKLDDRRLRDDIAIVPQNNTLFTGTIIDNIRWGNREATLDEVKKAAKLAQADAFISKFTEGYNTILGQGGVNLSGGQKQRISIARALVKNPKILILDDCTSAVDVITEAKIRSGLKEYSHNLICIIISQRISSVIAAEKIAVLENGELLQIGNHNELLAGCEIYRDIYLSQYGSEDLKGGEINA